MINIKHLLVSATFPSLPSPEMLELSSPVVAEMGQGSTGSSVDAGEGRSQNVADKKIILFLTESRSIICFIF